MTRDRDANLSPKRRTIASLTAAAAAALLVAGVAGWLVLGPPEAGAQGGDQADKAGPPAIPVETTRVSASELSDVVHAVGTVLSNESVVVRPEVAGRVAEIGFDEGQLVNKGDVLVKLDTSVEQAQLDQAEANLELSRRNYQRAKELLGKGAGTVRARDESLAQMRADEASVELAKARIEKNVLRAPFKGVIGLRHVSIGAYVSPGQDIVNLEDIDPVKVDFRVPETLLGSVQEGQSITITIDAFPGRHFEGTVYAIDPRIDATGRSIALRARIPNSDRTLRPGLFARVVLTTQKHESALLVPEQAIVPRGDSHYVFKVVDGKARLTQVTLGIHRAGKVEITKGLAAGDVVVTAGQIKLHDGAAVRSVTAPNDGA